MKRPLTVFGFTMLFTLLVMGSAADGLALVTVSITFLCLFILALIFRKIRQTSVVPTVFLGIAVACLLLFSSDLLYKRALDNKGENLTVSGIVAEVPEFNRENGRHYCVIKIKEIGGEKVSGKLRMSFSETRDEISHEEFEIGDRVEFTATVYETGENSESTKRYFRSQGINLGAYKIREGPGVFRGKALSSHHLKAVKLSAVHKGGGLHDIVAAYGAKLANNGPFGKCGFAHSLSPFPLFQQRSPGTPAQIMNCSLRRIS